MLNNIITTIQTTYKYKNHLSGQIKQDKHTFCNNIFFERY